MERARTVLIVEDEPTIAQLLVQTLRSDDIAPLLAGSVERGVQLMRWKVVDLVVSDLWDTVYGEKAWEPIARLREAAGEVPILICTAHAQAATDERFRLWISDVILKPFELDDVLVRIKSLLGGIPAHGAVSAWKADAA